MDSSIKDLVDRLHLKLLVADNDAKLQTFTDNHLVQTIELAAKYPAQVKEVTEILSYYNKRIKNIATVEFPVKKLLGLVGEGTYQTNLASIYLKMAFGRMASQDNIELLPDILERFVEKVDSKVACNDIFLLAIPGMISMAKLPKDKWPKLPDLSKMYDRLSRYFLTLMLFEPNRQTASKMEMFIRARQEEDDTPKEPPGLSPEEFLFIKNRLLHNHPTLTGLKEAVVRLLDNDFLPEATAFPVLVVASAASLNTVADAASLALKKVDIQNCVDDKKVVDTLMGVYLGSTEKNVPAQQKIPPCCPIIKAKILPYLTRSIVAPVTFMNNMKICMDVEKDIHHTKKTVALLQFVMAVTEAMPPSALNAFANTFFVKMLKVIESGGLENAQCAALAYRVLAMLGKDKPELVISRMDFVQQLFETIAGNAEDVSYAIMECLNSWRGAFTTTEDSTVLEKLKDIVKANIAHENNRTRLSAIKYAEALLGTGNMEVRWLLIRGAGDTRDDVRREGTRLLEASFKLATPSVENIVDYIWKEHNRKPSKLEPDTIQLTPETFEMSAKFIWAACAVQTGESQHLFFLDDDEHFFVTSPRVAEFMKGLPPSTVEKAARIALNAATFSQDLFLLRIATCFDSVHPILDMVTCSAACAQATRGSPRFEVLETASRLSVMTAEEKDNKKNLEKYLSDLDSNPLPGACWLAVSTAVYADVPDKTQLYERLFKRLLVLAKDAYDHPSSTLESALGTLALLLRNSYQICPIDETLGFELIDICEKVAASRKDIITLRARQAAVEAIGLFNSKQSDGIREKMEKALLTGIGEGPPQSALQIGVGAALWNTCLGPFSPSRRDVYTVAESAIQLSNLSPADSDWCQKNVSRIFSVFLTEKVTSRNHHLRRATVVWLMIFVQKASATAASTVKDIIVQIQSAFAEALTENDDFTQDVASKGMAIVYQLASPEEKKLLIGDLMAVLGEGRTSNVKVQSDTVVFQDNMLGKAPDGSSLTTYKELCNLATDLNQPDLLYKFMQLAKHNSTWNAKKGAAFGFGEILEQARDELAPYFAQLAPKLFRYRYDPDLKVQQSMRSIWSVLTTGRRNVVEEYADPIAKELIPLLTDREWRVRESSCLALGDLLHSNDTPFMHSKIPELFDTIMRVRDDIKESVRVAAERTADSLRKLIIRLATSSNKARAEPFLQSILPVIIERGVNSTVKPTVSFSLSLLIDLSKSAGKQLQAFLHILIPCLLDAISDNESLLLNYIAARATTSQLEVYDDIRSNSAASSPMMYAINDLVPYIDSSSLEAMQPRVCEQIRSSVGVTTRAAAGQFVVMLALRAPQLMMGNKPLCDKFFGALVPGVSDRNPAVRKNSATALSYLAKFASPAPIDKLMKQVNKNLVSDNEEMKKASLHVLKNFSAHCTEVIQGHGTQIIPYVFLETCREVIKGDEVSKKRHEEWNELWEEIVPSTSSALVLYRKEVVAVAVDVLQNNTVWSVRAQAGRMLAKVADALGSNLDGADADTILTPLLPLLSGRTWDGKEKILLAITSILTASGGQLKRIRGEKGMQEVADILKREAGRKSKDYVTHALTACAAYAERVPSVEMASWLQDKVTASVQKSLNPKTENSDSEEEGLTNLEKEALVVKFLSNNLVAFTTSLGAYRDGSEAEEPVKQLASYVSNTSLYWKARQDVLNELLSLVYRWQLASPVESDALVESLLLAAEEMCDHQRKSVAAQALQIVMKMAERRDKFSMNWDQIAATLQNSRAAKETGLLDRVDTMNLQMETD